MHLILKDSGEEKMVGYAIATDLSIIEGLRNAALTEKIKSGLAAVTLISTPNPVSQVLW
jgi:hypothetical protein